MASTTVRISSHAYRVLRDMASARGESLPEALDRIIEEKRRAQMFEEANAAYVALANDPIAEAAWQAEIAAWDSTLLDGLPDEPGPWNEA